MSFRTGSLVALLALLGARASAEGWSSARYGVFLEPLPTGWRSRTTDSTVRLERTFNEDGYGYAYAESMSFSVSLGETQSLSAMADQLKGRGYLLQERTRVRLGRGSVPLWIFFHQADAQEVRWVAVVLRAGLVYTFDVRGTPLDRALIADFKALIAAFGFLPDARQEGWSSVEAGEHARAEALFARLVRAEGSDANALYGLGLAELGLGRAKDALAHLERADRILGLHEVYPALGMAQLQTGDPIRAAVTWTQLLVDEPEREDELEPYLGALLERARPSGQPLPEQRRLLWEDFAFIAAVVLVDLQGTIRDARGGSFDASVLGTYRRAKEGCDLLLGQTLLHLPVEGGDPVEAAYLVAARDVCRGAELATAGLERSDLAALETAEQRLFEGVELLRALAPRER